MWIDAEIFPRPARAIITIRYVPIPPEVLLIKDRYAEQSIDALGAPPRHVISK